ncbi:protein O-GlcNAcase [Leucobacter soli]|uniref:protein O-GlcNAcase n=1 Tax=Leucobacter soli TaxID=2812850 RepID=UPI003618643E
MTFAIRGIIEGFYGRPWSHGARLDMIDFIAELGMNVYAYSPKDDPFLRSRWRDPLDDRSRRATQELITACGERDIDLWYCVSPGLTVEYGSDSEVDALVSRFSEIAEHGVRSFGVFLDDIPTRLQHTEDRGAYGDLVEAQLDFLARTHRALGARVPGARLIVCPTRYWGRGDEPGISRFGSGLPAGVELLWTGRQICSATIDRDDARRVELASGRRPIFWDNYPVNDVAMAGELHIGPFRGRSADLDSAATGLIANVMELAEASKIALATIADYLRDPAGYDPDRSWAAAIERLIPEPADRAAFVDFAENSLSSCLAEDDALRLTAALDRLAFLTHLGRPEEGAAGLLELASRYRTAAGRLRSPISRPLTSPGRSVPGSTPSPSARTSSSGSA